VSLPSKLVDIRRWGQCLKCHKFRELRVTWNDTLTEITSCCDQCFNSIVDEEAMDLIFEKAGVNGPKRYLVTAQSFTEATRERMAGRMFNLEKIFPEDD
jgi:hypothetical protein